MIDHTETHLYDRITGWLLPAIVLVLPFVIYYPLVLPQLAQSYFLVLATLTLCLGTGLAWLVGWRPVPSRLTAPAPLIALLAASVLISVFRAEEWQQAFKQAVLPGAALLFLGLLILHPRRRTVLVRINVALLIAGLVLAIYGILQFFGFEPLSWSDRVEKNVVKSTIGHPNYLASVLGPLVFVLAGFAFRWRGRLAVGLLGGAIFVVLFCIVLARTRGIWLGLTVAMFCLTLLALRYCLRHRAGTRLVMTILGVFALQVAGLVVVSSVVLPQMGLGIDFRERLLSNYEIKSRFYYWNAAIDMGRQSPVFGRGFAMFDPQFWTWALDHQQSEIGAYYYDVLPAIASNSPGHVHNEYLEIFCEQGYFGLASATALILFFLYFGYLGVMRLADLREGLFFLCIYCALLVSLVDAMFSFPWRLPISLMVMMVILAWLYELIYPEESVDSRHPRFS